MNYVLSFVFEFDSDDDTYHFAYSFPYTYSDLQHYLQGLDRLKLPFYKRETLCRTVQHRKVEMITIGPDGTCESGYKTKASPAAPRKVVFITARVHPGESPASYMCHGLMDFIISADPLAILLRKNVTFVIVPMINPDGVFNGNYRCAVTGQVNTEYWKNVVNHS
jgi:murein tripeptide amidase MpaA